MWNKIGGLLIEEFRVVERSDTQGKRSIDGIIVLNHKTEIYRGSSFDLTDEDIVLIQTKKSRLGMSLLGQVFFSRILIQRFNPRSIRAVAICGKNDSVLSEIAKNLEIEVIVITEDKENR